MAYLLDNTANTPGTFFILKYPKNLHDSFIFSSISAASIYYAYGYSTENGSLNNILLVSFLLFI